MKPHDTPLEDLEIVDLVGEEADDDEPQPAPLPRSRARRMWPVVTAIAVVVALVVASLVAGDPETDAESEPTATTTAAPRQRAAIPAVVAGPFVDSLDSRIALGRSNDILVVDPDGPAVEQLADFEGAPLSVLAAVGDSMLVNDNGNSIIVAADGTSTDAGRDRVIPNATGDGWWRATEGVVSDLDAGTAIELPDGTRAISAFPDGFVLVREAGEPLLVWTPETDPVPIAESRNAVVVAGHPHRIAFSSETGGANVLRVTDVPSGRTLVLPGVLPLFADAAAGGRFSPDGKYLALFVAEPMMNRASVVVVDVESGAVVWREQSTATANANPGRLPSIPFDFTADGARLVLALRGQRPSTIDLSSGTRTTADSDFGSASSVVTLDAPRTAPAAPVAERAPAAIDAVIGVIDYEGTGADIIDLGTGTVRHVDMSGLARTGGFATYSSNIVALAEGFVATTGRASYWIPLTGDPVQYDQADVVVAGTDRAQAWLFKQRDDGGWTSASIDGVTGAREAGPDVETLPSAVVDGMFVRAVSPSFSQRGQVELWDPRTGDRRFLDAAASDGFVATEHYLLIRQFVCDDSDTGNCPMLAVDVRTGAQEELSVDLDIYGQTAANAGDSIYAHSQTDGFVMVDVATHEVTAVPDAAEVGQAWVGSDGTVLMAAADGLRAWRPGMSAPVLVSTGAVNYYDYASSVAVH